MPMAETKYAKEHLRVKRKIEQINQETGGSKCVIISALAKEVDMDPRTLRNHLEVMEIDGYGSFPNKNKRHIFCTEKTGGEY